MTTWLPIWQPYGWLPVVRGNLTSFSAKLHSGWRNINDVTSFPIRTKYEHDKSTKENMNNLQWINMNQ